MDRPDHQSDEDERLVWRLSQGDPAAFEPLMERWGDAVLDTCFRALHDADRACDLYGEVWADVFMRLCLGTGRIPPEVGEWLVSIIEELIAAAACTGRIPQAAGSRLRLTPAAPTAAERIAIGRLAHHAALRSARDELPPGFSAAADLMLLRMPRPALVSRIQPSTGVAA
jgi:hypothetical protein